MECVLISLVLMLSTFSPIDLMESLRASVTCLDVPRAVCVPLRTVDMGVLVSVPAELLMRLTIAAAVLTRHSVASGVA